MKEDFHPATLGQKIGLVCGLTLMSAVGLLLGAVVLEQIERPLRREVEVPWTAPPGLELKLERPVSFWYDERGRRLIYRGPMDDATKAALLALAAAEEPSSVPVGMDPTSAATAARPGAAAAAAQSYRQAIEQLAFLSNRQTDTRLLFLLLLGGIGGLVGVQLRSVSNFIGVACVKNKLDFKRWWPWYALRPVLGFLVGVLVVVLTKADLYSPEGGVSEGSLWWLGLAVLAGFGAEDFGLRLRLISHTLFGVSELTGDRKKEEDAADGEEEEEKDDKTRRAPASGKAGAVAIVEEEPSVAQQL